MSEREQHSEAPEPSEPSESPESPELPGAVYRWSVGHDPDVPVKRRRPVVGVDPAPRVDPDQPVTLEQFEALVEASRRSVEAFRSMAEAVENLARRARTEAAELNRSLGALRTTADAMHWTPPQTGVRWCPLMHDLSVPNRTHAQHEWADGQGALVLVSKCPGWPLPDTGPDAEASPGRPCPAP